jgi:hypothetical protein
MVDRSDGRVDVGRADQCLASVGIVAVGARSSSH